MDIPSCPDWWPRVIWNLHFTPRPRGPFPDRGPVNYPPALDHIFSALLIHTSSYLLQDADVATKIRSIAKDTIIQMVGRMDALHDEAMHNQIAKGQLK